MTNESKFISSADICSIFDDTLQWCEHFSICVAWASTNEGNGVTWQLIRTHLAKLKDAIIGTHFCQTEPWILRELHKHGRLNVVLQTEGTFHPKVYLFENADSYRAIVGSHNFTVAAFSKNLEASVLLSGQKSEQTFSELLGFVDQCRKMSTIPTIEEIGEYEQNFLLTLDSRKILEGKDYDFVDELIAEPQVLSQLDVEWDEFFKLLQGVQQSGYSVFGRQDFNDFGRVQHGYLLTSDACQYLMRKYCTLAAMPDEDRKFFCGTVNFHKEHLEWGDGGYFGSMKGTGYFREIVNKNPELLDRSLGVIPLNGPVEKKLVAEYFETILSVPKVAIGGATRLLSMKRPDLFCNVNGENRTSFCDLLGVTHAQIKEPETYLECHERIWTTRWYNSEPPSDEDEYRCWRCRVALIDALLRR